MNIYIMYEDPYAILEECSEFSWDQGNTRKNWIKHGVSALECEQIFFNLPFIVKADTKHSQQENRYYALGKTHLKRPLFAVFTIRNGKIRVISARDMSKKERQIYDTTHPDTAI